MGNAIVTRIIKTTDYTTMSNHCFKNKNLSYKAKGMLAAMLSFPNDWNFSIAGLAGLSTDGESSVKSALNELKAEGYVKVYAERDDKGQISKWHYDICEVPLEDGNPDVENPEVENPHVENQAPYKVLNNKGTNSIKYGNNNEDNYSRTSTSNNISSLGEKKSKKEIDLSFVGIEFQDTFNEWLEYKRSMKDTYKTQQSVELCYRNLLKLSNNDPYTAQKIVEQSIANNWKGLFELKQSKQNGYGNSSNQTNGGFFCQLADSIKDARGVR